MTYLKHEMHFLITFWVLIYLNIIKLRLKLLFQSITHEKEFTNVPKGVNVCEILVLGVLLKRSLLKISLNPYMFKYSL